MAHVSSLSSPSMETSHPTYEEYDRHVGLLDDHQYFLNKNMKDDPVFDDKVDSLYVFMELYKKIEEDDYKKSAFYGSQRFKKGGFGASGHGGQGQGFGERGGGGGGGQNPSGYSYNLNFNRSKVKAWNSHLPKNNDERLHTMIDTYFNKISDETYKTLSGEFIQELLKMEDVFFFDILSKKVMDKCVMDNKYQHLYIQLCSKIWTNRQIHYNLANFMEVEGKFYWVTKNVEGGVRQGPFQSELDAKMDIYMKLNFKKYFVNYVQDLFLQKNVNFSNIESDDEFFLHKRQFMVLIEVMGIMYLEKHVPVDILHLMIINLLHIHSVDSKIENIEIDGFLNVLKVMRTYAEQYAVRDYFAVPIYEEYYQYVCQLERCDFLNKRSKFFLIDCKDILKNRKATKGEGVGAEEASVEIDYDQKVFERFKEAVIEENATRMLEHYRRASYEKKVEILYDVMYRSCEKGGEADDHIKTFLGEIAGEEQALKEVLKKGIESMEDLRIDIPAIHTAMGLFMELVHLSEGDKEEFLQKIQEISGGWNDEEDADFF